MSLPSLPPLVYKFMPASFDGGKSILPILKSGHIRFTQPKGMNDPYEIVGGFRDETDYRTYFQSHRREILNAARKKNLLQKKPKVPLGNLVRALNAIQESDFLVNGEMAQKAMELFQKRLLDYGILSMSTNWSSSAMWSHYARVHTGVCIGFDTAMPLFHRGKGQGILSLREVQYSDERVPLAVNKGTEGVPKNIFFRKSSDWRYEEEWRVVARFRDLPTGEVRRNGLHDGLQVLTLPIDLEQVIEILVGSRATPDVETAALEFARNSLRKVEIYKMRLSNSSFRMERIGPL